MTYKYFLDKSSKKFICPNCNKKSFVKYKDSETGNYMSDEFGRCDRESKCRYHLSPQGNKPIVTLRKPSIVVEEPSCHHDDVIGIYNRNYHENNFVQYLLKRFSEEQVRIAINKYLIGTSDHWNGAAIFWQIDYYMNICAGKVMLYDRDTGKRVKKPFPHINWMHKVIPVRGFILEQCLFGMHLLAGYEGKKVCIVESEKTAVIMSILMPEYLWMATGAKSNLKESMLRPLKPYEIVLFPDRSEYQDWNKKAVELNNKGFKIVCSLFLETHGVEEGDDLVDLLKIEKRAS